jgi:hypothetical protein
MLDLKIPATLEGKAILANGFELLALMDREVGEEIVEKYIFARSLCLRYELTSEDLRKLNKEMFDNQSPLVWGKCKHCETRGAGFNTENLKCSGCERKFDGV